MARRNCIWRMTTPNGATVYEHSGPVAIDVWIRYAQAVGRSVRELLDEGYYLTEVGVPSNVKATQVKETNP